MTKPVPWEMGSAFPLALGQGPAHGDPFRQGRYFGSGRQALAAVVGQGKKRFGWRVLHVPTYFCPEVVHDVARVIDVRRYPTSPEGDVVEPAVGHCDAVLVVSYFGHPPVPVGSDAASYIVDATHDPLAEWLDGIRADYVIASLRKTIPLPDGGVVWSPSGQPLPEPSPPDDHQLAGLGTMLSAMSLKAAYLAGHGIDKAAYLNLLHGAEAYFRGAAAGEMSAFSRATLPTFPLMGWRQQRIDNIAVATSALRHVPGVELFPSTFGVVLNCKSAALRDAIRSALISHNVYPAVLWDLEGEDVPDRHIVLSRRLLHLHADHRWDRADMENVSNMVQAACAAFDMEVARC